MLLAAVLLGTVALATERGEEVQWTASAISSVLYLAVVGTVVTFGLYFWAMRYAPASQLSLIAYVVPAVALFLGATFGDEPVGAATIGGAALILAGCAVVLFAAPGDERRPRNETP